MKTIMKNKMKGKNNNNHNHGHPTINSHRGQLFAAQFLIRSQNPRALLLSRTADKACAWHCRFKGGLFKFIWSVWLWCGLSNLMFGSIFPRFLCVSGICPRFSQDIFWNSWCFVCVWCFPRVCFDFPKLLLGPIMGLQQWSTLMILGFAWGPPKNGNMFSRDRFPKYIGN